MTTVKSVIVFVTVMVIVLFALSNVHHIQLHFITGNPFNVRLIYLVLLSYVLGVVSALYFFLMLRWSARKKARNRETEQAEDEEEF